MARTDFRDSVVSLDNVLTIPVGELGRQLGCFFEDQEAALADAIRYAYDLFWI